MQKQIILSTLLSFTIMQFSMASGSHGKHWGYEGNEGPAHWGSMSHDYQTCKSGKQQSPIDIKNSSKAKLDNIKFNYHSAPKNIVNNGHTIQINMETGSSITVDGKTYTLLQFHFHSPSEHKIDGKPADMVAHFVHLAKDGQLGVIGVLMKKGSKNTTLNMIWKDMPNKAGTTNSLSMANRININKLMPANKAYYNYSGSLTTPPCSESVNWMVLQYQANVSDAQVKAFTDIFSKSVRPVQPLNGRKVKSN